MNVCVELKHDLHSGVPSARTKMKAARSRIHDGGILVTVTSVKHLLGVVAHAGREYAAIDDDHTRVIVDHDLVTKGSCQIKSTNHNCLKKMW